MSEPAGTLLSVRGQARQVVPPDSATLTTSVAVTRETKAEAVRTAAAVEVVITVRAFELLGPLGAALTAHETVSVRQVSWDVDWDNPGWREVRAAVIEARLVADGVSLPAT